MIKKIITLSFCLFFIVASFGQVQEKEKDLRATNKDSTLGWKMKGIVMLNFSQTSFTNWSQGGENSIGTNGVFNYSVGYKDQQKSWDNNLEVGYGFMRQGSQSRKTDDKIDYTSKLGITASEKWYYAGLVNFKTQFSPGYNYPNDSVEISNFLAPAYIIAAVGMDYHPNTIFSAFISPLSGRVTIVNDDSLSQAGAFGVDPGKKSLKEFGAYLRVIYQKDIIKNVNLSTKAEAFSNYLKNPQNIAINWEMLLSLKVNKFISSTIATQLVYDDKVKTKIGNVEKGPKIQFREVLGIGFAYKF
jgi:hypothetical protein